MELWEVIARESIRDRIARWNSNGDAGRYAEMVQVLAPDVEFTSNLFPWLVHEHRGVKVETVPLERLADSLDATTTRVAFSSVQSSSGEVVDVDAVAEAARAHDAFVLVDATQACGWAHVSAASVDFLVCHGYKWLLAPRGTAFLAIPGER